MLVYLHVKLNITRLAERIIPEIKQDGEFLVIYIKRNSDLSMAKEEFGDLIKVCAM